MLSCFPPLSISQKKLHQSTKHFTLVLPKSTGQADISPGPGPIPLVWPWSVRVVHSPLRLAIIPLVAIYIDADCLTQLQDILCQLDIPFLLHPCPDNDNHDHFKHTPQNKEEFNADNQSDEVNKITASLSSLSTSEDFGKTPLDLFALRSVISNSPHSMALVSPGKERYYSITVVHGHLFAYMVRLTSIFKWKLRCNQCSKGQC